MSGHFGSSGREPEGDTEEMEEIERAVVQRHSQVRGLQGTFQLSSSCFGSEPDPPPVLACRLWEASTEGL